MRIEPLHGDENREDAMAFAEGSGGFAVPALAKQRDADEVMDRVGVGDDRAEVGASEDPTWPDGRLPRLYVPLSIRRFIACV